MGRLRDHYATRRGAKNGSVFRRYLGGALLRADDQHGCLAPAPGLGHWERQKANECENCAPYETLVTGRLRSRFTFTCVGVVDMALRNHLEKRLIASVAQCGICRPSREWLGLQAYSVRVRSSGLWNSDDVGGPPATREDLDTFRRLVQASRPNRDDLADTLLLIPCSSGKDARRDLGLVPTGIDEFLGPEATAPLREGRVAAFARTTLHASSDAIPALARYSGQPYATPGVVDAAVAALTRGLHLVIVSGGYGLVRAEEPIQLYSAHMQQTHGVWYRRLPMILHDYVARNRIRRTFGAFSRPYAAVIPDRLSEEDWRAVPRFEDLETAGSPMRVVPARVGELLSELLDRDFHAGTGWERS